MSKLEREMQKLLVVIADEATAIARDVPDDELDLHILLLKEKVTFLYSIVQQGALAMEMYLRETPIQ